MAKTFSKGEFEDRRNLIWMATSDQGSVLFAQDDVRVHVHPTGWSKGARSPEEAAITGQLVLIHHGPSLPKVLSWTPDYMRSQTSDAYVDLSEGSSSIPAASNSVAGLGLRPKPLASPLDQSISSTLGDPDDGEAMGPSGSRLLRSSSVREDLVPAPTCVSDAYAISVPLGDLTAVRVTPESLGCPPALTLTVRGGVSYPPLYFHGGGLRSALDVLKKSVTLSAASSDPSLYLVYASEDPMYSRPPAPGRGSPSFSSLSDEPGPKIVRDARDLSFGVLAQFSKVTAYAEKLGASLFAPRTATYSQRPQLPSPGPVKAPSSPVDRENLRPMDIAASSSFSRDSLFFTLQPTDAAPPGGSFEFLSASAAGPRPGPPLPDKPHRGLPLTAAAWQAAVGPNGDIPDPEPIKDTIFHGGIEPSLRRYVWPYIFGAVPWSATTEERASSALTAKAGYQNIVSSWSALTPNDPRWERYRDHRHQVEKDVVRTDRSHPYYAPNDSPHLAAMFNILVSYAFENEEVGYVQGMSDLLSPLLFVLQDEATAYWVFVAMMDSLQANFFHDQSGMNAQLSSLAALVNTLDPVLATHLNKVGASHFFFAFRWLLIRFKREFSFDNVLQLWEVLWSSHYGPNFFHLFVAAAVLESHRDIIIANQLGFDEILKYINNLSGAIPLAETLLRAEALYIHMANHFGSDLQALLDTYSGVSAPSK